VTITRRALLLFLSLLLAWKIAGETKASMIPVDDFSAYWAAARLQLQGLNPYSQALILEIERSADSKVHEPLVMLNPPWTIALLLPFGMLDYPVGRIAWLCTGFLAVVLGACWTWQVYAGSLRHVWVALLLSFLFLPLWIVLVLGQIDLLILVGITGFLYFESRHRRLIAGLFLVLMTIKPHLFYLFWIALILWVIESRRWSILAGAVCSGLAATLLATVWNPRVMFQYLDVTLSQLPPLNWRTPTFGTFLRVQFGMEKVWLQFIPMIFGIVWLLFRWQGHRRNWNWSAQMPLLILVSLTTTSYVWFYDQAILIPAFIQVAATGCGIWPVRKQVSGFALFIGLNSVLALMVIQRLPPLAFLWSFSAWLAIYLAYWRSMKGFAVGCVSSASLKSVKP
jgi:Glycosyltransferase family 87